MDDTKVTRTSNYRSMRAPIVINNDTSNQRSYILRLWVEVLEGKEIWRFSLEDTYTGKRMGFVRLEELFAFVQMQLREDEDD